MKASKGLKTKAKIIEVATEQFFQFGLYEVTYQKIAKGVGLTQPALYRHFENMDDLFLEACRYWDQKARQTIYDPSEQLDSASLQLRRYVERHFSYSSKHRSHDSLIFGLYYYSMRSKKMLDYYQELKNTAIDNIERILKFGEIDRSWKIGKTRPVAELIHSLIAGEIFKFLIEPKEKTVAQRSELVLSAIQKLLR
jgi:AcrR family transcriptional regulator